LPEEAIAPQMIPALITAADRLTESAMDGWGELLGLNEILDELIEHEKRS